MLWAAPMKRSSRSKAVTVTAMVIWVGAGMVIITDGVEAEAIISVGGIIIATDRGSATFRVRRHASPRNDGGLKRTPSVRAEPRRVGVILVNDALPQRPDHVLHDKRVLPAGRQLGPVSPGDGGRRRA